MKSTTIILAALLAIVIPPANADDEKELELEAKKNNACITITPRMYLQAVTNDYVYVESRSDKFLMTMSRGCAALERGYNIRFKTNRRRVCSNNRASLEYEDLQITMPACRIRTIDAVENWNEAQALMVRKNQAREKKAKQKQAEKADKGN